MFIGCFKTLVQAIEELVLETDDSAEDKLAALTLIRSVGDAVEAIVINDWTAMSKQEAIETLFVTNRQLTMEKNKYESLISVTSDIVLVTDSVGAIVEANTAASNYMGYDKIIGRYFWEVLGLEGSDITEVIHYYGANEAYEINLFDEGSYFNLRIMPLSLVAFTSGYMVLLTNISCLVGQRESLEKTVMERTTALADTEKQYRSLFQAAGESILLVGADFKVLEANRRSGDIFGIEPERFRGISCNKLCGKGERMDLVKAIGALEEGKIWEGEMTGRRRDGRTFPMAVTINRLDMDHGTIFLVLVRDVTRQKALESSLRREKSQMEELNITLRNVMKNIDRERQSVQKGLAQKVENLLLPALDKVRDEPTPQVRKGYIDIIRDQLINISLGADPEQDGRLLRLTPTEMKICQFIQAGSSTKDIAESMCLSVETIQTHRKSIRRKLGLQGRDVNLYTYLIAPRTQEPSARP